MKRKREHRDAAAPTSETTGPKLTDMADELVTAVLSYFDFYERSKYRLVCRRLMNRVDAMPPPPDSSLEIRLDASEDEDEQWNIVCDKDRSVVQATFTVSHEVDVGTMLSSLPHFGTVRPSKLQVKSFITQGVDIRLVSHLANTVGETVTDLHITDLALCNVIELQKTFLEFGENVKRLHLSTMFSLALAASAITCLSELTSVTLALRDEMIPGNLITPDNTTQHVGLLPLSLLSSLPCLEELDIRTDDDVHSLELMSDNVDDAVVASLSLGCASLSHLKRLSSVILDDRGAKSREAFAWMLRRLPRLTDLSMVYNPTPELWREVSAVGGHKMLRKLAIYYDASHAATRGGFGCIGILL